MHRGLKIFQYLTLGIVFFTTINAIAFIIAGILEAYNGISGILTGKMHTEEHPGLMILESLDLFLVALVFMVFSIGITMLFIPQSADKIQDYVPDWMNIKSFMELKLILWEAILTALIVFFVSEVFKISNHGHFTWQILIIPSAILILALSIWILRNSEKGH